MLNSNVVRMSTDGSKASGAFEAGRSNCGGYRPPGKWIQAQCRVRMFVIDNLAAKILLGGRYTGVTAEYGELGALRTILANAFTEEGPAKAALN